MYFYCYDYVFLLCVYDWGFFSALFPQLYNKCQSKTRKKRGTARTVPNFCVVVCIVCFVSFSVLFVCVLLRVKEQRNILHEIRKRKANWIGHILCRNCLLQRVTEVKIQGGIEVTGRQGRRRRKLLDNLKDRRGYSHLKEEALDRTMWRARFGRGFGPVVGQATKWMNEICVLYYCYRVATQLQLNISYEYHTFIGTFR